MLKKKPVRCVEGWAALPVTIVDIREKSPI